MPRKANDASRAGAVEGVRWYFSEDRPSGPPAKPFWLTYTGDDVITLPGIGLFQNGTTAEVDGATAARMREKAGWHVQERPKSRIADEDASE